MKKPNTKASKQEILEYVDCMEDQLKVYEEKLKKLQSSITPDAKIKKEDQEKKTLILQTLNTDQLSETANALSNFISMFVENYTTYTLIQEQIKIEKDRLENIYKIKVEAESLYALISSKKEIIDDLDQKINSLQETFKNETVNREEALKAHLNQLSLKHMYARQEERIKFESEMNMKQQVLAEEEAKINAKIQNVETLNSTIEALKQVINEYAIEKDKEIAKAVADAKKAYDKEKTYEMTLLKAELEKKLAVLTCEKDALEMTNSGLISQIDDLGKLIKESNDSIAQIATKTVDNFHMNKSLEDIKNIAITNASSNGNQKTR